MVLGDLMKTIAFDVVNEIVIKNSRFIALLIKIDTVEIEDILENIKKLYPKATHYCYGYIYNEVKHFSDAGEPGGTAGMPILNVLEKEGLNNILCVVVRYFGGIKLGAGGLVRAYTKSVTEALQLAKFTYLEKGCKVKIQFNYSLEKQINYLLRNASVIEKEFGEMVTYTVLANFETLDRIQKYVIEKIADLYIEKSSS